MTEQMKDLSRRFLEQRHQLLAFVYGLVRDRDVAEEILQEVWIRAAEAVERGVVIESAAAWCRGVSKNLVLHHYRRRRSSRVVADSRIVELAEQAFAEHDESDPVWSARRGWLTDCLDGLPRHSKELLHLKYSAGLRVADMAERLQRSQDAVMKALSRVRQALAECVKRRQAVEGTSP
jgi:RNA polymerase sigma-70 factor (ECF subfamily)